MARKRKGKKERLKIAAQSNKWNTFVDPFTGNEHQIRVLRPNSKKRRSILIRYVSRLLPNGES